MEGKWSGKYEQKWEKLRNFDKQADKNSKKFKVNENQLGIFLRKMFKHLGKIFDKEGKPVG